MGYIPTKSWGQTQQRQITQPQTHKKKTIRGKVVDKKSGKGIAFAALIIEESWRGVSCDGDGNFVFTPLAQGRYKIEARCLNYASTTTDLVLRNDTTLLIQMQEQSLKLPDVEVMASFRSSQGSNATIGQAALEYIQPTSLADIFLLLPGNIITPNSLHTFNLITSRQVGSDKNTSLGMGVIADGVPLTNDAMRTQMYGIADQGVQQSGFASDWVAGKRSAMNAGIDMRNISTDHIESVEIVRGISSAKEGNISSGAIHIHSKKGATPLRIRAKSDPLNKLLYIGKGFKISDKMGALHLGMDGLFSTPDVRELLERYTRITGQAHYTNKVNWHGKPLDFSFKALATSSVNDVKSDELIEENDERYNSRYQRLTLSLNSRYFLNHKIVESVEWIASLDMTHDLLTRHKMVLSSTGPSSMPIAKEAGEHEGIFLPVKYYTDYSMDNKPIYFFSQINLISRFSITDRWNHRLQYGLMLKTNKNIGKGAVVDPERPPYPSDNTFIRPRPNYEIPTMTHSAFYVEDKMTLTFGEKTRWDARVGVRGTQLLNLPKHYFLNRRLLIEPRLQSGITFKGKTHNNTSYSHTFRIGYGEENKLPTLDMLYPDKLYRDFVVLNAYYQDPKRDYLLVNTYIHTPENPHLRENKNRKVELGWDYKRGAFEMSVSAFREFSNAGFSYFPQYYPISFNRYLTPKHPVTGRPGKEDYHEELYKDFTLFPVVKNSAKTIKRGVEYRVKTPVINPLNTSIEMNGAYYLTVYTKGIPVMYRPNVKEFGNKYPYVGIYQGDTHIYRSRFNTNMWINTHIPRFGMVFTNFIQVVWFSKSRYGNEEDVLPSHYIDLDGKTHEVDRNFMASTNDQFRYLRRERSELYYRTQAKPISIFMNIKASKSLGTKTVLSFFVNNLIDINPHYKAADKTTEKQWAIPYFGAELTVQL